ncbi:MAG: ATP-binding cassette domain-containing protein [Planctomycetes bacterium]|nr:ATP-binding cassette domain-containing protein [Planctomycetota bacterium]
MPDDPAVQTTALTHRYGERLALDHVDLKAKRGSILALLGPNGGGKTTLFKILTTLLVPSEGTASVAGFDVRRDRDAVRGSVGIVFQKPSLDDKLSVIENMQNQGNLYGMSGKGLRSRSMELLERFGLGDRAGDRVATLSGGLQRRVELAKGLLHRPDVLILDEPSTGLDPGARAGLMDYLQELRDRDGVTSLLTTHLMDEADRCDQVAILDEGRLIATGTPASLKGTIGGDVLTVRCDDPVLLSQKASDRFDVSTKVLDGAVRIERDRGHEFVPDLIEAFPGEINSVTVGRPTLDDVFLHLTGHRLWDNGTDDDS